MYHVYKNLQRFNDSYQTTVSSELVGLFDNVAQLVCALEAQFPQARIKYYNNNKAELSSAVLEFSDDTTLSLDIEYKELPLNKFGGKLSKNYFSLFE